MMFAGASTTLAFTGYGKATSQTASQKAPSRAASSITGRVVNETGQPMPNVRVFISGSGRQALRQTVNTDEAGKFVVDGLPRGTYTFAVQAPSYVSWKDPRDPNHYSPGDTVNLVIRKGAVITGRVTNSDGEPVVGVPISPIAVRDSQGRPVGSSGGGIRYTDDRGVYRLFGLPAGTYIVAAAAKGPSMPSAYSDDAPTYYPSSTRDTAAEVTVQYGSEATGIDIRYRGEPGYAISGIIMDASMLDSSAPGISVFLMRASSESSEGQLFLQPQSGELSFAFYGVPDGDYYLTARRGPYQSDDGAASKRMPVKVRGHSVTGVALSMAPLGSIAGRLTLDLATRNARCETKHAPSLEETLISFRTDYAENSDPSSRYASILIAPDAKGDFIIQGLPAGRYRLDARRVLDESWYVSAITAPGPTNTPVDVSLNGFNIRPGQRINGFRVVLGEGAASIRGRVVASQEGASLPDRLRIHLVPAEQDSASSVLRFFETEIRSDGTFKMTNLTPGRYWVTTRRLSDEEAKDRPVPRAIAWNTTTRAGLRRQAEASKMTIELKPCQRVTGYEFRSAPQDIQKPKRP